MAQVAGAVTEDAEHLMPRGIFRDAVVVVEPRLRRPADVEDRVDVGFRPFHDLAEFLPVVDLLVLHPLDRRAGDDETVETPVLHVVEVLIEGLHVRGGGVGRFVARGLEQRQVDLQGGVREKPDQLGLGRNLGRHQVQDRDTERTDVLRRSAFLIHHEDILVFQRLLCREFSRDPDRHS